MDSKGLPQGCALVAEAEAGRFTLTVPPRFRHAGPLRLRFASGDVLTMRVGEDAELTCVEEYEEGNAWSHAVRLEVGGGAQVTYVSVQSFEKTASCTMKHAATIGAGARLHWCIATLGGAKIDHALESQVTGGEGESTVDWIAYARGKEDLSLGVRNIFAAPDGSGEVTMRGVAEGHARIRARGMIEIGKGGSGTNTYLTQAMLMLDPTAKVDAVPGLEIKTNDVKASHGATVARVSDDDLFYFAARGIPREEARRMFIDGFLGEIIERMPGVDRTDVMRKIGA